ncbi:hypothetical protein FHG87_025503, partial [Trinorchestia longiramus]
MAKLPELISKENVTNFLESFDAFMTDCDGVLWSGDEVLN